MSALKPGSEEESAALLIKNRSLSIYKCHVALLVNEGATKNRIGFISHSKAVQDDPS